MGVALGDEPDLAGLLGGQHATGYLDAHHERIAALALGVEADPLEALDLTRDGIEGLDPFDRVGLDDALGHLEGVTAELHHLRVGELAEVAIGAEEGELSLVGTAEVEAVGIVGVDAPGAHRPAPNAFLAEPTALSLSCWHGGNLTVRYQLLTNLINYKVFERPLTNPDA